MVGYFHRTSSIPVFFGARAIIMESHIFLDCRREIKKVLVGLDRFGGHDLPKMERTYKMTGYVSGAHWLCRLGSNNFL